MRNVGLHESPARVIRARGFDKTKIPICQIHGSPIADLTNEIRGFDNTNDAGERFAQAQWNEVLYFNDLI